MSAPYIQTITFGPIPNGIQIENPVITFTKESKNILQDLIISGDPGVYYIPYTITNNKNSKVLRNILGPINILDPNNPAPIVEATPPQSGLLSLPIPSARLIPDTSNKPITEKRYIQTIIFGPEPTGLQVLTPQISFYKHDDSLLNRIQVNGVPGVYFLPYRIINNKNNKVVAGTLGPINILDPNNPSDIVYANIIPELSVSLPTPAARIIPDTSNKPITEKRYTQTVSFESNTESLTVLTPSFTFTRENKDILKNLQVDGLPGVYYLPYRITNNKNNKILNGLFGPINILDPNNPAPIIEAMEPEEIIVSLPGSKPKVIPDTSNKPINDKIYTQFVNFGPAPTGIDILTPELIFTKENKNILHELKVQGIEGTYYLPYIITNNKNNKTISGLFGPINILEGVTVLEGIGYWIIESTFVVS